MPLGSATYDSVHSLAKCICMWMGNSRTLVQKLHISRHQSYFHMFEYSTRRDVLHAQLASS